ncbi:hypothetical protein MN116_008110 [Schistosoma mekongi]|uniref:Proteasome subunit beta n=1 Tax=Schistosoma mekongi TaxID=38744 RepID=A0AAE1Z734_SCHME|nr:hypothetical protein MN116_008110 [Schistosoma mekongi]
MYGAFRGTSKVRRNVSECMDSLEVENTRDFAHVFGDQKHHTMTPICTGTSVIGIKYKDGVVLAADLLVSYGSLAKYMDFERMFKVNESTVMCCSGDVADFQFLKRHVKELTHLDNLLSDGFKLSPHALHSWITRILYNRRSRLEPLWNTYLVGGIEANGEPFIGYCNMLGVSFSENYVATGFGAYLATPILRECLEIKAKGDPKNIAEEDAISTITSAMKQLYFRDCRAFDTYQLAVINKEGIQIHGPLHLKCDWSIAEYVKGYD